MSVSSTGRLNKVLSSLACRYHKSTTAVDRCRKIRLLSSRASPICQRFAPVLVPEIISRYCGTIRWNSSSTDTRQDGQPLQQQPPPMMDAFSILQVERKFDVSPDELKQSYRNLMATFHPDKHHSKPLDEQEELREQASQITQAYQILTDIPARATHLLQLLGRIDAHAGDNDNEKDNDNASKRIAGMEDSTLHDLLGESSQQTSMRLLMEVMELREAIEEASSNEELQQLLADNSVRMDEVYQKMTRAFATTSETGDAREPDLDQALEYTVMMQYYKRIDETIRDKMDP